MIMSLLLWKDFKSEKRLLKNKLSLKLSFKRTLKLQHQYSNIKTIMEKLDNIISTQDVKSLMAKFMDLDVDDTGLLNERSFRLTTFYIV